MATEAPTPSNVQPIHDTVRAVNPQQQNITPNPKVSITIVGAGGCGINFARNFKSSKQAQVLYFDTSKANTRPGESVYVIADGSGSGSNRAAHAPTIERHIPQLTDKEIGVADVAAVIFSLSGGTGSVIGPLMIREYARRGQRVIAVIIADTGSAVAAKNTSNTLKTLYAIANNNGITIPIISLTNDNVDNNREVDETGTYLIQSIIDILTIDVIEVDRNDRLNWIDSSKVTGVAPGLKIMTFNREKFVPNPKIVLGTESDQVVDSLLILQKTEDATIREQRIPLSKLKKVGIFIENNTRIIGTVSSDISCIDSIIDQVEKMQHAINAQKHGKIDRLAQGTEGGDDLFV